MGAVMADYSQAFADIKARVATALPDATIVQTHQEGMVLSGGVPIEYVVLTFGGPVKYSKDRGIVESSRNPNVMWVIVQCVSALPEVSGNMKIAVINALEDFVPDNSGRMTPDGGFATDTSDDSTFPTRYVSAVRFSFIHNLATA